MKFIVFGLGNYGSALSQKLVALGHEVIGVDQKMELVEKFKNELTHTIAMDAGSPEAVRSLPLRDVDVVVNAIGENEGSNIMLAAVLKQLSVKRIICRVITALQKTVLEAMDIQEFVYPEEDSAERLAYQLDIKGVTESYRINEKYQIVEVLVPDRYIDHKVSEIDFDGKYGIHLVTLTRNVEQKNIFGTTNKVKQVVGILTPDTLLRRGDRMLIFGEVSKIEDFVEE
jgi:trk system potassium uptake protein TrkA